ncbi:MAG: glycosyltransferase [Streptosporangiaceae bacterium]
MIEALGVVIPAHDEEALLPSCLAAVTLAARLLPRIPVQVIVVADACGDRTAELAEQAGAQVVRAALRNVGRARRAGVAEFLRLNPGPDPANLWIATTDADTLVPPCWLSRQLTYAAHGWEAVVGTILITDWDGYPEHSQAAYVEQYAAGHPHVHGANLGVNAAAYQAVGGFDSLLTGEDHALVNALAAAGRKILHTTQMPVVTSARRDPRAPAGFGDLLARLERDGGR